MKEFTHQHQAERHVVTAHSGFTYCCSHCKFLYVKMDQRHRCKGGAGATKKLVKRSTMTFTDEERVEYGNYVKKSGSFDEQFMKPLVIPMSDQPDSAPQRKRTQPTMPHHVKKNKNAMNPNNSSTSLTAMDECGD